jgi:opacity protein-like surface antigen
MTTVTKSVSLGALALLMAATPSVARAQDFDGRLRLSFAPAVATVGGDAELALGGSVAYRFSQNFWFEGEITWIDAAAGGFRDRQFALDTDGIGTGTFSETVRRRAGTFGGGRFPNGIRVPDFPTLPAFPVIRASTNGSTMIGTLGIRYELPVQTSRFRPYVGGGLGINNTDQEIRFERTSATNAFDGKVSHTGYAFSAGAGASFSILPRLWADVDAKYFRLSQDRDIMRLGGGVSVRF